MFSGVRKCRKTEPAQPIQEKTERLKELLWQADAVLTGAGAGLSTSAGFTYSGERFRMYFSDFEKKYGFHDMYSGGFYPYASPEEYSTNVDHCFQKAGFEKKRLFYTQGDYGLFQCSEPCCQETWENEEIIDRMVGFSIWSWAWAITPRCYVY